MVWLRKQSRDAYKLELMGPVEGVVTAEAQAPSRFGVWVTEATNTGRRVDFSLLKVDSEICHKHTEFGGGQ